MERNFVKIKTCKKIKTLTIDKKRQNGWLLELLSDKDEFTKNIKGQMYMTVLAPGAEKGYHIHAGAEYYVTCIRGNLKSIIYKNRNTKQIIKSGEKDFKTYELPVGYAHLMSNEDSKKEAWVLCYRFPAWSQNIKEQINIHPSKIKMKESWDEINKFVINFENNGKNK